MTSAPAQAPDILVVGAGPTGLTLALQAHDHGARVRIVERRAEAFRPSRALILHPRTLEVLRPLGLTDALLERADAAPTATLRLATRTVPVSLANLDLRDTPFPHLSLIRQTDVEDVLAQALKDRGVVVERGTTLISARDGRDQAVAALSNRFGLTETACGFVVGCDGPDSTVRAEAGIGWAGGPYSEEVVLADIELEGRQRQEGALVVSCRDGLLFLFPLGERATWRMLATRPARGGDLPFGQPGPPVPGAELQQLLSSAGLDARIVELAWSARVPLQHRLAPRFRRGRLFLAGDAAHVYSPATGQGMNAGIQDAANLGWKLALSRASTGQGLLLDSYERERRPVARRRFLLTHAAFWAEASTGPLPSWLRGVAAPLAAPVLPFLLARRRLVAESIGLIGQLRIGYRHSPVSSRAPGVRGPTTGPRVGDRLPDAPVTVPGGPVRLHDLLAGPGVHLLLQRDTKPLEKQGFGPAVTVCRLTSQPGRGLTAVRPDGHVGFHSADADLARLRDWLAFVGATAAGPVPGTTHEPRHLG